MPPAATAIPTGNRRRRATCTAPMVAGGVAAGDTTASAVSTAVAVTGRHSISGVRAQPKLTSCVPVTAAPWSGW